MLRAMSLLIVLSCCSVVGYSFVFCCMMMVLVATPFVLNDVVGCNLVFFLYDVVDYHVVFAMDAFFVFSVACDMSICCNVVESATKSLCDILR